MNEKKSINQSISQSINQSIDQSNYINMAPLCCNSVSRWIMLFY